MTKEVRGTLAVFGAALGYCFLPILAKLALAEGVRLIPMVTWRFVIASATIWLLMAVTRRAAPRRQAWPGLVGLGLLYAVNATAYLSALQWLSASFASLVFFTYPIVVIGLAALFLGERLTRQRMLATLLAVGGCALIVGFRGHEAAPAGLLLIVIAVAFVSLYILFGQQVMREAPAHGAAAVSLLATAVVMLFAAWVTGGLELGGGGRGALLVAAMGVLSTAFPVTLLLIGIRDIGPGQASVYATVEPFLTVLLAAVLLGERIAPLQYAGGFVLLSGVLWLRLQRPPHPPAVAE